MPETGSLETASRTTLDKWRKTGILWHPIEDACELWAGIPQLWASKSATVDHLPIARKRTGSPAEFDEWVCAVSAVRRY